jgi:hypothetical protein
MIIRLEWIGNLESHAFRHTPFVKDLGLPCPRDQFNLKKPFTDKTISRADRPSRYGFVEFIPPLQTSLHHCSDDEINF